MKEMKELVKKLNAAAKTYYSEQESIMSDKEYDALYDQLLQMEQDTGEILPDSPTRRVGYEVVSELKKVQHEYPALSLDKTKDPDALCRWLQDRNGILSWKLDGLTAVATWENGKLLHLVTRGNGQVGEDVTHNAPYIDGLPMEIMETGHVVVRGEVLISYPDFEKINLEIENPDERYKNPRNLASSSLRLMDSFTASKRRMQFRAFELVTPEKPTIENAFHWMKQQEIEHVAYQKVKSGTVKHAVDIWDSCMKGGLMDLPTDGLVLAYDDIAYGRSLGTTGKFPKHSIAFKWADDTVETKLLKVEWSASRSGLINPVAVFEPVELEGTTVTKASLHNLSYLKELELGYGDTVTVYKANKIIPQLDENLTHNGDFIHIPEYCPVCGEKTVRKTNTSGSSEFLHCTNAACPAKHAGRFVRMAERDALNIKGVSKSILERLAGMGMLKTFEDIFYLQQYKDTLISLDGFGEKSYENMIRSIKDCRHTTFRQFFYALGIPGAGHDVAKILEKHLDQPQDTLPDLIQADDALQQLVQMDGIGEITAKTIVNWFTEHMTEYSQLKAELIFDTTGNVSEKNLTGITFVITGSLTQYENRDALKAEIERRGGKVSGSVSKKTDYLINNDTESTSGKNKKAKELGIPVISEADFQNRFLL